MQTNNLMASGLSLLLVTACSQSGHDGHDHAKADSRHWPPQLEDISNQQLLPSSARTRARNTLLSAARASILNNPDVREAIGPVISEYQGSMGDPKSNATAIFLFYNYSSDNTVEATLLRDGSIEIESFAAEQFQPTENADEVTSAINLAKVALESGGYNTQDMQGTAMLAYPPAQDTSSLSNTFYPQRMLYVTFGPGEGELPEYSALVNLSSNIVSQFGSIK